MSPLADCALLVVGIWLGSAISHALLDVSEHTAIVSAIAGTLYTPVAYYGGYLRGKAVQQ